MGASAKCPEVDIGQASGQIIFMQQKRIFVVEYRENTFYLKFVLTFTIYVCFVYSLLGMRKCQSSWLGTKWT